MPHKFRTVSNRLVFLGLIAATATGLGVQAARANRVPNQDPQVIELAHTDFQTDGGETQFQEGDNGGYDFLQYTPEKMGDSITFAVPLRFTGQHHLKILTYKTGGEGTYALEMDGKEISRKDYYKDNVWDVGDFPVQPGMYYMTFRCVDKNPKSGGIGVSFGNLQFR